MNVTGAGLDFEISGTNKKLMAILQESEKAIKEFGVSAEQGGAKMDAAYKAAAAAINKSMNDAIDVIERNENEIAKLEEKLKALKMAMNAPSTSNADAKIYSDRAQAIVAEIRQRTKLLNQAREATNVLEDERTKLEQQRQATEQAAQAQGTLRTQLRGLVEQLAVMEQNGQRGTEAYRKLQQEAGRLTDAMGDARTQARIMSHDNQILQATLSGVSGLTGAFTAAQGAAAMFGTQNEALQRAMLKVQAAMSITMGLQQVMNTLNKDSAFMITTVTKAKTLLAAANTKLATALNISSVAAKGLMASLTLGLSVAITGIIWLINKMQTSAAEASAQLGKVAEIASEPVAKVELLAAKWNALGNSLQEKKRFIVENKKAFEELGVSIRDVADAENLLIENKDKFIRAQIEKAKAQAYIEANKDKIKELIKAEEEAADKVASLEKQKQQRLAEIRNQPWGDNDTGRARRDQQLASVAAYYDKAIEDTKHGTDELSEEITKGYTKAAEAQQRALGILKGSSIDAADAGQEATAAMLDYIENGTTQAEAKLNTFADKVKACYNNLISDLSTSTNQLARGLGMLLTAFIPAQADDLGDGTIGDRITKLKEQYKTAQQELSDLRKASSTATAQEIKDKQDEVSKLSTLYNTLTGLSIDAKQPGAGTTPPKDPFAEQLKERRKLYEDYIKWATSSDETIRNAAAGEFAPLLQEGETYLIYLENQRAAIETKAVKTATDLKNLNTLNNEIAATTKQTVINDFDTQLQAELAQCATLGEMLDLIAKKRKDIEGDKTEVGDQKREVLNTAEADTKQKVESETAALLSQYAKYQQEKLLFEASYARRRELLVRKAASTTSEAEKQIALKALEALEAERTAFANRSNSETYDRLKEQYTTTQQQLTAIQAKYAAQRAEAEAQGNYEMVGLINAKEREELSKLAASRLMTSESWNALFSDLSRLSTTAISRLYKEIESRKLTLSAQLNPADLKAVNEQLDKASNELRQRNPFLALKQSLAELRAAMEREKLLDSNDPFIKELEARKAAYEKYQQDIADLADDPTAQAAIKTENAPMLQQGATFVDYLQNRIKGLEGEKITLGVEFTGQADLDKLIAMLQKVQGTGKTVGEGFKDTFANVGSTLEFVTGCFNSVVGGIKQMGISMDEETEAILGNISGMMEGATQLAQGIATSNPLGIVQGSIGFISSVFSLFNSRDRKAEKSIKRHQQAVEKLKNAYNALQHAVDNALGETVYQNQNALLKNLRAQQAEINGMISDELSKKHTDQDKLEDYRERYRETGRQIQDIIKEISQSITQTSATDLAGKLADALIEAFEGGKDAAKAFGDVANDVIKKAVANALKLQFLEKPLQAAIAQLQRDMGFDTEGNGSFDGLTEQEQARFKAAIAAAGANFQAAMEVYKDLFQDLDDSTPTTLSGAIKGASQESIDLLAGQTNAVRQNQIVAAGIMREQLLHLANIDNGVNTLCQRVQTIINKLSTPGTDYRAEGITD